MKTEAIRWGIIGCGDVTEVKSGPAFSKVPNSKLVAVMRRNEVMAEDYARRHHVAKWYSDADDLINDPEVNAIYVATPPLHHEEYAVKALHAGKPVYVEKPMAINTAAAQRIKDAVEKTGVKLTVAHYRRQQPMFLKIKELLDSKLIGEVRLVNMQMFQPHQSSLIAQTATNWRVDPRVSGGGLFFDLAPHQLDLMLYFFGLAKKISGISLNAANNYNADDITCGQVLFDNRVLFNGAWCFSSYDRKDYCEIIGSEGKISFSIFDNRPLLIETKGAQTTFEFERLQHVQQPMIEKVVEYFLNKSPNPCSASEGVQVMHMMAAMTYKSA